MGNSMMKIIFSVLACAVLATASSVTIAEAAPQALKAEQNAVQPAKHAVYTDAKGNRIDVITYEDGTFKIFVNHEEIRSDRVVEALSNSGLFFRVEPHGEINIQKILDGVKVLEAPHSASFEGLQEAGLFSGARNPALPAGLVVRPRRLSDWKSSSLTFAPSIENNLNEKPISK